MKLQEKDLHIIVKSIAVIVFISYSGILLRTLLFAEPHAFLKMSFYIVFAWLAAVIFSSYQVFLLKESGRKMFLWLIWGEIFMRYAVSVFQPTIGIHYSYGISSLQIIFCKLAWLLPWAYVLIFTRDSVKKAFEKK